jgi:hypothetical protein
MNARMQVKEATPQPTRFPRQRQPARCYAPQTPATKAPSAVQRRPPPVGTPIKFVMHAASNPRAHMFEFSCTHFFDFREA